MPRPLEVLLHYPPDLRPLGPLAPVVDSSGASGAWLFRLSTPRGQQLLRRWPDQGPETWSNLTRIHRWLNPLGPLAFVPRPWPALDGSTLVLLDGHAWELAPWMPGRADGDLTDPDHVALGFDALARVHRLLRPHGEAGPSPAIESRINELELLLSGDALPLRDAIERGMTPPERDLGHRALDQALRLAPAALDRLRPFRGRVSPLQPCLRDARPEHFLFVGAELTGLVDFGALGQEHVSIDLARLLADWIGHDPTLRARALAAYDAVLPLDDSIQPWIEAFEWSLAALGGLRWIRWTAIDGRRFRPGQVQAGLERCLRRAHALPTAG